MFLGNGKSRRSKVNHLLSAFHPEHGLVWADSQCVYLSSICANHDGVSSAPPTMLGQFDSVEQVAWSSDSSQCYLSVQHTTSVTVWNVSECSQKLKFDKVSEIQTQAIPQGCLWHPVRPLLVILCHDQLHLVDPGTSPDQILLLKAQPSITAGTWSMDGSKVIVAVGRDIIIYKLDESNQLEQERIVQNFPGPIRCLVSLAPDLVAMAHNLPLEQLVNQSQVDMFEASPLEEQHVEAVANDSSPKPREICSGPSSQVKGHKPKLDHSLEREILQKSGPVDINAFVRRRIQIQSESVSGARTVNGSDSDHHRCDQRTAPCSGGNSEIVRNIDHACEQNTLEPLDKIPKEGKPLQESQQTDTTVSRVSRNQGITPETDLTGPGRSQETLDLRVLRQDRAFHKASKGIRFKRTQEDQVSESSQVSLVSLGGNQTSVQADAKSCTLSSIDLPCILNPDLLVYQRCSNIIVVGSNSQTKTYQVSLRDGKALGQQRLVDMNLSKDERCLGLSVLPCTRDLLLLTGETLDLQNLAFLPSSNMSEYQFKLRIVKLHYEISPKVEEGSRQSPHEDDLDPQSDLRPLTLPNGSILLSGAGAANESRSSNLVQELASPVANGITLDDVQE